MTDRPTGTDRSANLTDRPTAVPHTRSDWWSTPSGSAARKHLEAWGAVAQIRHITGDETAVPAPLAALGGSRRGYGMPDVLTAFAEVSGYFADFLETDLVRLMTFIYRDGLFERSCCQFVFEDGTRSDVMTEAEAFALPPPTWDRIDRVTARALDYDLHRYEDPELDAALKRYDVNRTGFLEARHRMVAKTMADDLGLGMSTEEAMAEVELAMEIAAADQGEAA